MQKQMKCPQEFFFPQAYIPGRIFKSISKGFEYSVVGLYGGFINQAEVYCYFPVYSIELTESERAAMEIEILEASRTVAKTVMLESPEPLSLVVGPSSSFAQPQFAHSGLANIMCWPLQNTEHLLFLGG